MLIAHLLKWKYQPDRRSPSWRVTMEIRRIDIADVLNDNQSLRQTVEQAVKHAYPNAVKLAATDTGFSKSEFPETCEWSEK
ncbi:DUF29 domain-containing protein [Methylococcus sp. Mc7]|nr:DUF29 domain-containing protein [Methylococcus sp. Mc7]